MDTRSGRIFRFDPPDWGDLSALTERIEEKSGLNINLIEIQVCRSLAGINFAPKMSAEDFGKVEKLVKEALKKLGSSMSGLYLSLESSPWSREMVASLSADHILFDHTSPTLDAPLRYHWPVGRAVFHTKNRDLVAWVNHSDHLILRSIEKNGNVRAAVSRLQSFVSQLQKQLKFAWHKQLGYLSLKPTYLGSGLQIKVSIDLPKLANNQKVFKCLCAKYDIATCTQNQHSFQLCSTKKMGLSEFQTITQFFTGIKEILEFEQ